MRAMRGSFLQQVKQLLHQLINSRLSRTGTDWQQQSDYCRTWTHHGYQINSKCMMPLHFGLNTWRKSKSGAYIIADNKLMKKCQLGSGNVALELKGCLILIWISILISPAFMSVKLIFWLKMLIRVIPTMMGRGSYRHSCWPSISKAGDIWQLGSHHIYCGNNLENQSFQELLEIKKPLWLLPTHLIMCQWDGHVCGKGSAKHSEFAMASGEMSKQIHQF